MTITCNSEIEQNTTYGIDVIVANTDLSNFDFIYMAKAKRSDADSAAVIKDINISVVEEDNRKIIRLAFSKDKTKSVNAGNYYHFLRAVSKSENQEPVIPVFEGSLKIKEAGIKQP